MSESAKAGTVPCCKARRRSKTSQRSPRCAPTCRGIHTVPTHLAAAVWALCSSHLNCFCKTSSKRTVVPTLGQKDSRLTSSHAAVGVTIKRVSFRGRRGLCAYLCAAPGDSAAPEIVPTARILCDSNMKDRCLVLLVPSPRGAVTRHSLPNEGRCRRQKRTINTPGVSTSRFESHQRTCSSDMQVRSTDVLRQR